MFTCWTKGHYICMCIFLKNQNDNDKASVANSIEELSYDEWYVDGHDHRNSYGWLIGDLILLQCCMCAMTKYNSRIMKNSTKEQKVHGKWIIDG